MKQQLLMLEIRLKGFENIHADRNRTKVIVQMFYSIFGLSELLLKHSDLNWITSGLSSKFAPKENIIFVLIKIDHIP